jgi:hypothetical protein
MMLLPNNEIGISDILQYRDCAQRFAFGMRRHQPLPERFALFEGERDDPPEATNPSNVYGSCIHEAISIVEKEQVSDAVAIDRAWARYGNYLDPEDLDMLKHDLQTFHTRSMPGYRLVAAEKDMRFPLFVHEGRTIYFRFKLDALYQHLQNSGVFVSRDYKSSKWRKNQDEVDADLQQWSYNLGIHEVFPECRDLTQQYDQLRFGVLPTRKTPEQRAQIKVWLIQQVKAMLADDTLAPKQNQWCPWCPLVTECRVTHLASDYWRDRIAAIAPEEKVGRKTEVQLDPARFEEYAKLLPGVKLTIRQLQRFEETVNQTLLVMPSGRRRELGFRTRDRKGRKFNPAQLRRAQAIMGDHFYEAISLSKAALERMYGRKLYGTPGAEVLDLGDEEVTATWVESVR